MRVSIYAQFCVHTPSSELVYMHKCLSNKCFGEIIVSLKTLLGPMRPQKLKRKTERKGENP